MLNVSRWAGLVSEFASSRLIPLILGVIEVESSGDPNAKSSAGAVGLMQLMPQWHGPEDQIVVPRENIRIGVAYLLKLISQYNGSTEYGLAAYNYGPGRIKAGQPLPAGAASYARKVLAASAGYQGDASVFTNTILDNLPYVIAAGIAAFLAIALILKDRE
jgi:hypothetical protein